MTDTPHEAMRDALPDFLFGALSSREREVVESHLQSCEQCATELRVLEMVKSAPSFAPRIDAVKISSAILPYPVIIPRAPRPVTRYWQAGALAAAMLVALSIFAIRNGNDSVAETQVAAARDTAHAVNSSPASPTTAITVATNDSQRSSRNVHGTQELQVAAALDDLSDASLVQLARDVGGLDPLPSGEPEPLGVGDSAGAGGSSEGGL